MNKQKIMLTLYKQYLLAKPLLLGAMVVIVFGFMGALFVRARQSIADKDGTPANGATQETEIGDDIKKIGKNEPVKGDKNARYVLIEYSDYECPFCKDFHDILNKLIAENKDFKWVYRNFPLAQLHPGATDKAIAATCVFEEAGNDKFWEFSDALFENQSLPVAELTSVAEKNGVAKADFEKCVKDFDKEQLGKIYDAASKIGVSGTPSTVIVDTESGNSTLVVGGLSADEMVAKAKELN
jgi:protein-disulfide isomerase